MSTQLVPTSFGKSLSLSSITAAFDAVHPVLSRRFAEYLFLKPQHYKASKEQESFRDSAVRLRLPLSNCTLHGYRWGSGPAVLLVHGWSGSPLQFMGIAESLVERGYSCVAFEMPGHGHSSMQAPTVFDFSEAISEIKKYYGSFAAVAGHSIGALACAHAHKFSPIADKLILISPLADARAGVTKFGELTGIPLAVLDRMQVHMEQKIGVEFSDFTLEALTASTTEPILAVHDTGDRMAPFEPVASWASQQVGARLYSTSGLGHQRLLFDLDVVEKTIDFIGKPRTGLRLNDFVELAL